MALNTTALTEGLLQLFSNPPDTTNSCATAWADAMEDYAVNIFPPSTTVSAAATALEAELITVFQSNDSKAMLPLMETAFANFAAIVGTGMAAANWAAVPPPGEIGFADFCDVTYETHEVAVLAFVGKINAWMITGTATLTVPPFTFTNWL